MLPGACYGKGDPAPPGGSSPLAAVQTSVELVKAGDFNGLWNHRLPPADYANLRADWNRHQHDPQPIAAADRTRAEQLRMMDFDAVMDKYPLGYGGLRRRLAIHGLSGDDTLDSVTLREVSNSNDHAVVRIVGKPLSTESKLVQEDGRWNSEDMRNNVRKSHQRLSQPAAARAPAAMAVGGVAGNHWITAA